MNNNRLACSIIALAFAISFPSFADTKIIDGIEWSYSVSDGMVTITGANPASGSLVIPASFDGYPVTSIGKFAFCSDSLTSVTIPDSVTVIDENAFNSCDSLTSVTIGNGVTTIANFAFCNCGRLTTVIIPGSVKSIGDDRAFEWYLLRFIVLPEHFSSTVERWSLHSECVVQFYDPNATLAISSGYGSPSRNVIGTNTCCPVVSCAIQFVQPDYVASDIHYVCTGWKGTGSVPATGTGTNCTFVLMEDSTLEWLWNTNVWISLAVDGEGSSSFRHGWFDRPEPAVVPFDAPAGLLRCTLSGDADGVTVDQAARTVSIPTDRPRAVSLHVESLCKAVETDGKFVDYAFGGDAPWIPLADESLPDGRCLRSGVVGSGKTSVLETTVSGAGRISFRWKTSCNRGDYCKFIVDGTEVASISRTAAEWATVDRELGEGNHVLRWSWEKSASAVLGENGAFLDDVRWRPYVNLSVASTDGTPSPATGTTRYLYGGVVEASVAEPAAGARTRRVCTGWTGTGCVPASGTNLATTFAITNDSTVVWNWRTEYWIDVRARGAAKTDFTACWLPEGSIATVEFTPTAPVAATAVLGDSAGTTLDGLTLTVPVDGPRTVTVRVTAPNLALDVASAHGGAVPAPGRSWYECGTEVYAGVAGPAPSNGVQYVCTGWTGTGSVPASGTGTNLSFSVSETSSLTWTWRTNVWLSLSCEGLVVSSLSGEWVEKGTTKRVFYEPLTAFYDLVLAGDTGGVVWDRAARTLDVPADRSRALSLSLAMLTLETALDAGGLSWTTSGASDWIPQADVSSDGIDAARSGGIATGEESVLSTTLSGPGTLSWSWRLDADGVLGVDVELDGAYALSLETSGTWETASLDVEGAGAHVVRFVFWNEDLDATARTERAYLDGVSWSGAVPAAAGATTASTPVPVLHSWLSERAPSILSRKAGSFELAAAERAANGRPVWECFIADLDPEDPASDFKAGIVLSNGVPVVTFDPDRGPERVYAVEGKETLGGEWGPTNAASRFFRVRVSLPDSFVPSGGTAGFPGVVTLTLDANGGTVTESTRTYDAPGTVGNLPNASRSGHGFGGWYSRRDGGVLFDASTILPWTDFSLFARWNVTLRFDRNGGTGNMADVTTPRGQPVTLPENGFTRTGHSFGGWAQSRNGAASYQPGDSVAFASSRTLYSAWKANNYTISFDSAGGSAVSPVVKTYGSAIAAPTSPVLEGHEFAGWTPPLPRTMPASNLVATATWRVRQPTLSFDSACGSAVAPITQDFGTPVARPADPTRTGYTFAGWSPACPTTMPGSDTTLVAQWTPNRYLVRFRQNGGVGGMLDQEMVYGESSALHTNRFVKTGHSFAGWAMSSDGSALYADSASVRNLAAGAGDLVELFATWRINQYTVSFDPNGGSAVPSITQDYGTAVDPPADPTRQGFTFVGWEPVIPVAMPSSNVTCRARWTNASIRFEANGGSGTMDDFVVIDGELATLPPLGFSRQNGAPFLGWSSQPDGDVEWMDGEAVSADLLSHAENGIVTLYACWSPGMYRVRFNPNGGTGEMPDLTLWVGFDLTCLPSNAFVRTDFSFVGWGTNLVGHVSFEDGETVSTLGTEPNVIVTLYAQWVEGVLLTGCLSVRYYDISSSGYSTWSQSEAALTNYFVSWTPTIATNTLDWGETLQSGFQEDSKSNAEAKFSKFPGLWLDDCSTNRYHGKYANQSQNYFAMLLEGGIGVDEPGEYRFATSCDDQVVLYVDGSRVCATSEWGSPSEGAMTLSAGLHRVVIGTYEKGGSQGMFVSWKKPGDASYSPIPQSVLVQDDETVVRTIRISFDANGGEGNAPIDIVASPGASATLPSNPFVRQGYTFLGWAGLPGGDPICQPGDVVAFDACATLYAAWSPIEYTIHFDENGGSGEMPDFAYNYDMGAMSIPACSFSKQGHSFVGWATEPDAVVSFGNLEPVRNVFADHDETEVRLYAVWHINRYTVSFNSAGGSSVGSITENYGTVVTQPNDPTRMGYTFAGWSPVVPETMPPSNITCVAHWIPNRYTIRFNANGGTGEMGDLECFYDEASLESNGLSVKYYDISSSGYSTWTQSEAAMKSYFDDKTPTILTNTLAWGVGLDAGFSNSTGSDGNNWVSSGMTRPNATCLFHGGYASSSKERFAVLLDGYLSVTDSGTYQLAAVADDAVVLYVDGANVLANGQNWGNMAAGEIALSAGFHSVSIGFYENTGGQGLSVQWKKPGDSSYTPIPQSVLWSNVPGVPLPAVAFSGPNGAAFLGWSTTAEGLMEFEDEECVSNLSSVDGDIVTLYAKWNRGSFTVHFDANGGTGEMADQTFVLDVPQRLSVNAFAFPKPNYSFAGWATNGTDEVVYADGEIIANIAAAGKNVTLRALWSLEPLAAALNANLVFTKGGDADWFAEIDDTHDGFSAARSGAITHSQNTWIETTVNGPGTISFWWKVSSKSGCDYLRFYVDGSVKASSSGTGSGWTQKSFSVSGSGSHTLRWTYSKYVLTSDGSDCGWIDEVVWISDVYSLQFDANGGMGTMADVDDLVKGFPVTLPACGFSRRDWTFVGWARSADGAVEWIGGETVPDGFFALASDGVTTLFARWSQGTYTVRFEANGGTGTMADATLGSDMLQALPHNSFTKDGMRFSGWATNETGDVVYVNGATVHNLTGTGETTTLWAVWELAPYCIVDFSGGSSATSYPVTYLAEPQAGGFNTDEFKTTKLVLRLLEPGPVPTRDATITKPFYIGLFEVTQKQWELVMGSNPSSYKGDKRPVECVSYNDIRGSSIGSQWPSWNAVDADSFLGKLRARTGVDFDLPTEAQWEYACRAGTTTDYNNGTNYGGNYNYDPNLNLLGRYWYNRSDGRDYSNGHTTVGSYQPNAWGLYDMLGNVCEWCLDWKGGSLSGNDPVGSSSGSYRVQRGGSWCDSDASGCTSSYQYSGPPSSRSRGTGFRLVGALPTQWTPQDYTITFDSAGGSEVASITAAYGATVTAPASPTKEGYTFAGWSPAFPSTMPLGGATLTAQWTPRNYTVTFDSAGGSAVPSITAAYGSTLTAPTSPTKEGYTFAGWSPAFPATMPLGGAALTAQWTPRNYTVTFDSAGGSAIPSITAAYGSALTVPASPTRDGYTFAGWSPAFPATMPLGGATLTAQWMPPMYLVIDLSNGPSGASYPVTYLEEPPAGGFKTDEYKTTKLVLRCLDPGPIPTHDATITKPFYVGLFEVTQKQYELIMGSNPSYFLGDTRPVECVSYDAIRGSNAGAGWPASNAVDAGSFLGKLRSRTGLDFDLPTEAQWEYACRAGTTTTYGYGNSANGDYMWYGDNSSSQTHAVGEKLPNAWGLYDMHGNVWEWCLDWSGGALSGNDPVGSSSGSCRVFRGGGWHFNAGYCTSSFRYIDDPSDSDYNIGFRLVRPLPAQWTPQNYTITFDSAGGSEVASITAAYGTAVTAPAAPTKDGYDFAGWSPAFPATMPLGGAALVAQWTQTNATSLMTFCIVDLSGGANAASYPVTYLAESPSGGFNTDEYKTTKLVLLRLDPGPVPTRDATITKPFYIGLFEVTQKQYELVTGSNPSSILGDMQPVAPISYHAIRGSNAGSGWPASSAVDADSFLGKFRVRTGLDFDLPTEAQWEYACRAGTTTSYNYGNSVNGDYMWYYGNSSRTSHVVGTRLPNDWGLFDMHGNVWEWCLDWYDTSVSQGGFDPVGVSSGSRRVRRGGGWNNQGNECASNVRSYDTPSHDNYDSGFRLVRTLSN